MFAASRGKPRTNEPYQWYLDSPRSSETLADRSVEPVDGLDERDTWEVWTLPGKPQIGVSPHVGDVVPDLAHLLARCPLFLDSGATNTNVLAQESLMSEFLCRVETTKAMCAFWPGMSDEGTDRAAALAPERPRRAAELEILDRRVAGPKIVRY